ncbi:hypothetical protein AB1Z82_003999 [Bacillus cereus]
MSQFLVRYQTDPFPYYYLPNNFADEEIRGFGEWIYAKHSSNIRKSMTKEMNSEWITRNYLSAKMILASSMMLNSLNYAKEKNLKMAIPYFSYYALLTSSRAFLYSIPYNEWKNDKFLELTHKKVIKLTKDYLNHLDKKFALNMENTLQNLKEWRELFSYKFPASGITNQNEVETDDLISFCGILCELAQLSSEQLQKYIIKNCIGDIEQWKETTDKLTVGYNYKTFIDKEDWYRIDYIKRKQYFPASIYYTMSEGMVEDYFNSWIEDNDAEDIFNDSDIDWGIIFPCP